jgi:hypothetical protein
LNGNSDHEDKSKETNYAEMGFRDCISQVSQHLLENEGLQAQNPFRLRLLSHLKCFAEQKSIEIQVDNSIRSSIDNVNAAFTASSTHSRLNHINYENVSLSSLNQNYFNYNFNLNVETFKKIFKF